VNKWACIDSISPSIYEPQRLIKPKAHQVAILVEARNISKALNLGYQQQEYEILRYWDLCAEDVDPGYAGRRSRNQESISTESKTTVEALSINR
jgi:hypothetical protein